LKLSIKMSHSHSDVSLLQIRTNVLVGRLPKQLSKKWLRPGLILVLEKDEMKRAL